MYTTTGSTTTLAYFPMPEGRVRNNAGTLKIEYVITDQQGNSRISLEDNGSGIAVVRQENSYYAFGMVLPSGTVATPAQSNRNLYNGGAEWQNDYGDLPDLQQTFYRMYDAALGRLPNASMCYFVKLLRKKMGLLAFSLTQYLHAEKDSLNPNFYAITLKCDPAQQALAL